MGGAGTSWVEALPAPWGAAWRWSWGFSGCAWSCLYEQHVCSWEDIEVWLERQQQVLFVFYLLEKILEMMASQKNSEYYKCNTPETASSPLQWKCVYQSLPIYCFWWKHNLATELASNLYSFYYQHPSYFLHSCSFFLEFVVRWKKVFPQSALKNVFSWLLFFRKMLTIFCLVVWKWNKIKNPQE